MLSESLRGAFGEAFTECLLATTLEVSCHLTVFSNGPYAQIRNPVTRRFRLRRLCRYLSGPTKEALTSIWPKILLILKGPVLPLSTTQNYTSSHRFMPSSLGRRIDLLKKGKENFLSFSLQSKINSWCSASHPLPLRLRVVSQLAVVLGSCLLNSCTAVTRLLALPT